MQIKPYRETPATAARGLQLLRRKTGLKRPVLVWPILGLKPLGAYGTPQGMGAAKILMPACGKILSGEIFGAMVEAEILIKRWANYSNRVCLSLNLLSSSALQAAKQATWR